MFIASHSLLLYYLKINVVWKLGALKLSMKVYEVARVRNYAFVILNTI
jgi:hypothetical protein